MPRHTALHLQRAGGGVERRSPGACQPGPVLVTCSSHLCHLFSPLLKHPLLCRILGICSIFFLRVSFSCKHCRCCSSFLQSQGTSAVECCPLPTFPPSSSEFLLPSEQRSKPYILSTSSFLHIRCQTPPLGLDSMQHYSAKLREAPPTTVEEHTLPHISKITNVCFKNWGQMLIFFSP